MKRTCFTVAVLLVGISIVVACSDGILSGFDSQETGTAGCALTAGRTSALSLQDTSSSVEEYPGFQCIRWDLQDDGRLKVDLLNFPAACIEWHGRAEIKKPGTLRLSLEEKGKECMIAACESCTYDWSFDLKGVNPEVDLKVSIVVNPCPDEGDGVTYEASLPTESRKQGILCRYQYVDNVACGSLHGPCNNHDTYYCNTDYSGDADSDTDSDAATPGTGPEPDAGPECQDGLECSYATEWYLPVCLKTCVKDDDCPLDGLLICQVGLCFLKESW